jgi:hypothetical protein
MPGSGKVISVVAAVLVWGAAARVPAAPGVEVKARPDERRVDVRVDGQPFTAYIWPERLRKPVLYPLRTAKGTIVTRGFPLDPRPGERADHPHQVGLWFDYGDVNGVDFWNNSDARPPEVAARMGTIRHRRVVSTRDGKDEGVLEVAMDWVMPSGETALDEAARFVFRGGKDTRGVDRITTLTAKDEKVVLADNKEGLLGIRVARALEAPSDEPEVFTDASGRPTTVPVLDNTGVNGVYTSSEGKVGNAVWGTRARWVALSGRVDGEDVVLLLLDHPKNPGFPTYWHARTYGLFAANPLGQKIFSKGKEELNLTLAPGASTTFRYRLLILPGPLSTDRAEAAFREFAAD